MGWRETTLLVSALLLVFAVPLGYHAAVAQGRFSEDFEGDLSGWRLVGAPSIEVIESKDANHGRVLVLGPNGGSRAWIEESDQWGPVRVEADCLFPNDNHNYLGLIYNYTQSDTRTDYGNIYIKGNGSYIRANPWRDGNVSRLLYEEYKTPLTDDQAIRIDHWHKVKAEIMGNMCHFYVGDMSTPKLTFDHFEKTSGLVGFEPRIVGWPVWIDNVSVTAIDRLSYEGPDVPAIVYEPDSLLTRWEVIGPLKRPSTEIEWAGHESQTPMTIDGREFSWTSFPTDSRGAVVTGKITQFAGERTVAYFRTVVSVEAKKTAILHFSTADELALWVGGRFEGFIYRDGYVSEPENDWNAWYDFWKNPEHAGRKMPVGLEPGNNRIVVRVRNGEFASGGFFARLEVE
jgi:hypothetical protein